MIDLNSYAFVDTCSVNGETGGTPVVQRKIVNSISWVRFVL